MNEVNPVHYTIHLEPDLRAFKSSGSVEISLEATGVVNEMKKAD